MAINITAAGSAGTHSFRKVNVNTVDNYVYFTGQGGDTPPAGITQGTSYIYTSGIGSIGGITEGDLVFADFESDRVLKFLDDQDAEISLTSATTGGTSFNFPIIYDNILNIGSPTATNQAVKYFTDGTALTGLTSGNTYFLKNVAADFSGTTALYSIASDTHTFTTCGQTGRQGPNNSQIAVGYSTDWHGTYVSEGDFRGYQDWTVPVSGIYRFDVKGASGYEGSGAGTAGRGARIRGEVSLTKGEIITVAVGQRGSAPESGGVYGGSGGGTFVVRKISGEALFVAGGGSADAGTGNGIDAALANTAADSTNGEDGGTGGNGGSAQDLSRSAGGGGFFSRGENSEFGEKGGGSYLDGLQADSNLARTGGEGGFGGGASSDAENSGQSGGGGGYSGGSGARSTIANQAGGGGGSFVAVNVGNLATSTGSYNNSTNFNGGQITDLDSFNTGEGEVVMEIVSTFTSGNEVYPTAVDANAGTNKIAIAPAGNSYHSVVPINFDIQNDVIHSPAAHTLVDGEAVVLNFNVSEPLGIFNDQIYYVNTVNAYTYRVSTTEGPTFTNINLTVPSGREVGTSSSLSRVIVNTATNSLTINNHGFQVDQPLLYSNGGGADITPLQDGQRYYIDDVVNANQIKLKVSLDAPNPISFTAAGTGTAHSFLFLTVDAADDSLYIPNHGLVSGQLVKYSKGGAGNAIIPGLTDDALYYILREDDSIVKLTTDSALESVVNITNPDPWTATGTHSLVVTSLDFTDDIITIPGHGFLQGELVEYDSRGQTVVTGLTSGTPYYVIFIDGDNIKLATTPENAVTATAVDLEESPSGVGRHTLRSLTKTPDGTYVIDTVPSATTFTAEAQGNVPVIEKIFNPRSTVDLTRNAFFLPSHGFLTGTRVTYAQGTAATDISGLTDDTDYFVVTVNNDYIRLASSAANAASGVTLDITGFGTGVAHSLTATQINGNVTGGGSVTVASGSVLVNGVGTQFSKVLKVGDTFRLYPDNTETSITFADTDVDTDTEVITKAHSFTTGETVKFNAGGGVSPSPLISGYYYFVRAVSGTEIKLYNSEADANADTGAINFNTTGSGSAFTLTETELVSPVIRKITAVGSDTQITVDRPYASAYSAISYSFPTFIYVRPAGYSLHRPFDGGVEMSVGTGTWYGQIIRQTRKYFRYQSGKGIQTSAGINFQPSIDIQSMTKFDNNTVECKTRRPHGLVSGLFVTVSQATDSFGDPSQVYNGDFQITVVDLTTFRMGKNMTGQENKSYGFPQFYVREWTGGAVRSGMFDFQNGMFYEFDGQEIYCVRRSSTQQLGGSVSALQGSEEIFGTNTSFQAQVDVGDYVVLRGQTYRIVSIDSDTRMAVRPEYKGSSGNEKEFDPTEVVNTSTDTFEIVGHGFSNLLPVVYNSIDGEPIGGLINGRTYYIDLTDNNNFKLLANPDSQTNVSLSSEGTTTVHSFVPAKSGIVVTKTVDTKIPQADWSIDPCDGSGPTGYDLDISKIQMMYIDYSWYGAGKIRFGFKTTDGQVQYTHEFVHNNNLYESYFRSGNLPARYEVVTYENPTYIPYLFHWGTSVMMDGRFDDDNAYLFTANSQTLNVSGTTPKSFSSGGIDLDTDLFTVLTHGFRSGDLLQFQSIAANGFPAPDVQNPATEVIGSQTLPNLTNGTKYRAFVNSPNLIHLTPEDATITVGATFSRSGSTVTVVTAQAHNIPANNNVGIYFVYSDAVAETPVTDLPESYVGPVTVSDATTFTFTVAGSATVSSTVVPGAAIGEVLNFTSRGNTQFTYSLFPDGSLNNTSGPNYQPLISLRLSPSVSEGLTGALGDRDVINRMQLRLQEVGISSNELVDVKMLLNGRLNNLNFAAVDSPSLTQIVEHTAQDTVSGGIQVYNFRGSGTEETTVDVSELFELSNSILGGDSVFPDGPDIITIAVSRLTGNETRTSAKLSWTEAQA